MLTRRRLSTIMLASTAALAMLAGGCQKASSNNAQQVRSTHATLPAAADAAAAAALSAAGEPFEVLTEESQTADAKRFQALAGTAEAAYRSVRPQLAPERQKTVDTQVAALRGAVGKRDRLAAALSAVEVYRSLLEAQAPVPTAAVRAGLLDYAGFRYQALAKAPSSDWAAMRQSVSFAQDQWQRLSPEISSAGLRDSFKQSLDRMSAAIAKKDVAAARRAAIHELNLVDELEKSVAAKKGA